MMILSTPRLLLRRTEPEDRAAIAAIRCEAPVTITGAECVKKSYPRFWEDYRRLGGELICDI